MTHTHFKDVIRYISTSTRLKMTRPLFFALLTCVFTSSQMFPTEFPRGDAAFLWIRERGRKSHTGYIIYLVCLSFYLFVGWSTGKVAFVQLADLLNIEVITLKSRPHPLQGVCPAFYLSAPSRLLCQLVQHRWDRCGDIQIVNKLMITSGFWLQVMFLRFSHR